MYTYVVDNEEKHINYLSNPINFYATVMYPPGLRLEIWQAAASLKEVMENGEMGWHGCDKHDQCLVYTVYIYTVLYTIEWHTHIYTVVYLYIYIWYVINVYIWYILNYIQYSFFAHMNGIWFWHPFSLCNSSVWAQSCNLVVLLRSPTWWIQLS